MTYYQLRTKAIKAVKQANIELPEFIIDQLLLFVFKFKKSDLIANMHNSYDIAKEVIFYSYLDRVLANEPLDLILGSSEFYMHTYKVTKGVLIPRPETELLVDSLKTELSINFESDFCGIECGFGTGIISIELGLLFPKSNWFSYDVSEDAYKCATTNAANLNCTNVTWKLGDFFEASDFFIESKRPICLVSNPPYILTSDLCGLDKSVRDYDPITALDGGEDGLVFYRKLFEFAKITPRVKIIGFECGLNQSTDISNLAHLAGFRLLKSVQDYNQIERVLIFIRLD